MAKLNNRMEVQYGQALLEVFNGALSFIGVQCLIGAMVQFDKVPLNTFNLMKRGNYENCES